jgi:hypothetical protein
MFIKMHLRLGTSASDTGLLTVVILGTACIEGTLTIAFVLVTRNTFTRIRIRINFAITDTVYTAVNTIIAGITTITLVAIAILETLRSRGTLAWGSSSGGCSSLRSSSLGCCVGRTIADTAYTAVDTIITIITAVSFVAITITKSLRSGSALASRSRSRSRSRIRLGRSIADTLNAGIKAIITVLAAVALVTITITLSRGARNALGSSSRFRIDGSLNLNSSN